MTTLQNRPNTALLVIDVQTGVLGEAYEGDTTVANVGSVVERARAEEVPVVWVQHSSDNLERGGAVEDRPGVEPGQWGAARRQAVSGFVRGDDARVRPRRPRRRPPGVGRRVVVGAQTDECVRSTLHGALVRGYDATLVSDAHTTEDLSPWGAPPPDLVIAHTNLYWSNHEAPGPAAGTVEAKEVDFAAS